jgi:hypothetical protein
MEATKLAQFKITYGAEQYRRQIVIAAIQGLCASGKDIPLAIIAEHALKIADNVIAQEEGLED